MKGFKLIAIIPLKGCDRKYRKNIETGQINQFYKNYKIKLDKTKSEVQTVEPLDNRVPDEFFRLENGINLSFSAVVGKNGTGKSTLFELLYYFIYIFSTSKPINKSDLILSKVSTDLNDKLQRLKDAIASLKEEITRESENRLVIAIVYLKEFKLKTPSVKYNESKLFLNSILKELETLYQELEYQLNQEKELEEELKANFSISILFEVNKEIREFKYINKKFEFSKFKNKTKTKIQNIKKIDLQSFFYNVSLNYSHHSLNSKTLGKWINKLFHKNDAYLTPVAINPMRDEGNFNINTELNLSKERLMANVLFDLVNKGKVLLLEKYHIKKYIFSLKSLKNIPIEFDEHFINRLNSKAIFNNVLKIKKLDSNINFYWPFAISYLEDKILKIEENYPHIVYKNGIPNHSKLVHFLLKDNTHISKKLRQVINFLEISYKHPNFWKGDSNHNSVELTEEEINAWLNLFTKKDLKKLNPSELLEVGLPGFFNIDFLLSDKNNKEGKGILFSKLSSGEQQMILNTNSILYHLFNLNSVHNDKKRISYNNINIILDEVELYYHPEMQRRLINELVNNFERIKNKNDNGITSINVCILTHSPFILSDIPKQNVLILSNHEKIKDKQTFGANIHEILLDDFFMKSTIGEYATTKIDSIINFYKKIKIGSNLKKLKKEYSFKEIEFHFIVETIGEPVIQGILANHIEFIESKLGVESFKQMKIKQLEEEIKRLRK